MSKKRLISIALLFSCFFVSIICIGQNETEENNTENFKTSRFNTQKRGKNAISIAGGSAIMNGDYQDPIFEIYFHAGYKRFISSHVNINFTYHKFNLAYSTVETDTSHA